MKIGISINNVISMEKVNSENHNFTSVKKNEIKSIDIKNLLTCGFSLCWDKLNILDYKVLACDFLKKTKDLQSKNEEEVITIDSENESFEIKETYDLFDKSNGVMITSLNETQGQENEKIVAIKGKTLLGLREDFLKKVTVNKEKYIILNDVDSYTLSNAIDYAALVKIYHNAAPEPFNHLNVQFASVSDDMLGSIYFTGGRVRLLHGLGPEISTIKYQRGVVDNKTKETYRAACSELHCNEKEIIKIINKVNDKINCIPKPETCRKRDRKELDKLLAKCKDNEITCTVSDEDVVRISLQKSEDSKFKNNYDFKIILNKKSEMDGLQNKSIKLKEIIKKSLSSLVVSATKNVVNKNNISYNEDMSLFEFIKKTKSYGSSRSVNYYMATNDGELEGIHFSRGIPKSISLEKEECDIIYGSVKSLREHMEYEIFEKYGRPITKEAKASEEYKAFERKLYKKANKELYDLLCKLPTFRGGNVHNPDDIEY